MDEPVNLSIEPEKVEVPIVETPPVSPVIPSPVEVPPSIPTSVVKEKKDPILFYILALMLIVAGLVFSAYNFMQKKNSQTAPVAVPTSVPQPTESIPTPTPDVTANWKTYTNTKYEFEFKYPQEWEINRGPGGESDEVLSKINEVSFYSGNLGFSLQIDEFGGKCLTLKDCINKVSLINSNYKNSTKGTKTFLDNLVEVITYNRTDTQPNQNNVELFGFVNGNFYHFHFYDINSDFEKTKIIFDQILSTFKFTE